MPELSTTSGENLLAAVASDAGGLMLGGRWVRRPRLRPKTNAQRLWGSEHVIAAFFASQ
jgi:hypothetical protein